MIGQQFGNDRVLSLLVEGGARRSRQSREADDGPAKL
jgi:hypothetical protein